MSKIRIHKDITTRWRVKTNGQATSLAGRDLSLYLIDPIGNYRLLPFSITDTNLITFVWYGKDQEMTGDHSLVLFENDGKEGECAVDAIAFVTLVSDTTKETTPTADDLAEVSAVNLTGNLTSNGRGASAYEIWISEGHTGTAEDFMTWLRKPATDAASTANSAASAANSAASNATTAAGTATAAATAAITAASHQPYINSTNNHWMVYTNGSYVDSGVDAKGIKGNDGAPGAAGKDGADGKDGAPGKDGKDGSDASVTAANIQTALGFAPAKASDVTSLDAKIGKLERLDFNYDETFSVNGYYINAANGYAAVSANHKCSDYIPVRKGDIYKYNLKGSNNTVAIIAFYTDKTPSSMADKVLANNDMSAVTGEYVVPNNGYIRTTNRVDYADGFAYYVRPMEKALETTIGDINSVLTAIVG